MKKLLYLLAAALVLAMPASSTAAAISVKIVPGAFTPAHVTINTGDTVTWTNSTNANHQVVANDGTFTSPVLKAGQTYSFTFKTAGKFAYRDSLNPTVKGSATVQGPAPEVTLAADSPVVTYGSSTTISGKISSGAASESVSISSRALGASTAQQLATVTTSSTGTFTYTVNPSMQTTYTATWKGTTSQSVTIQVRPRLTLQRYGSTRLYVKARTANSLEGHFVYLQRLTGVGWITVGRITLGASSGRIFKAPHLRGYRTYRTFLGASQAGTGYLEASSNKVRVYFRR